MFQSSLTEGSSLSSGNGLCFLLLNSTDRDDQMDFIDEAIKKLPTIKDLTHFNQITQSFFSKKDHYLLYTCSLDNRAALWSLEVFFIFLILLKEKKLIVELKDSIQGGITCMTSTKDDQYLFTGIFHF
jgi:WD40 repeat protein